MKWVYSIKQKGKAALLLALVLGLVVVKNIVDSRYVRQLGSSFAAVYEDRLLVESYIFQLSGHLYQKKMTLDKYHLAEDFALLRDNLTTSNEAIATLLQDYEKTQLTPAEARHFGALKQSVAAIQALEYSYLARLGEGKAASAAPSQLENHHRLAAGYLSQLSHIQVAEGKRLRDQSKRIIAGSTILTQFEVALLICIGVMILMLVFASKSAIPKFKQKAILN
jgi:hypothetical protein